MVDARGEEVVMTSCKLKRLWYEAADCETARSRSCKVRSDV